MNSYEIQAEQFLKDTGTTLDVQYLRTSAYFVGDTDKRDIYRFTLKNAKGGYSAEFGDSMHNTQRREFAKNTSTGTPVSLRAIQLGLANKRDRVIANKTIRAAVIAKPTAYHILACMQPYYPATFKEFCGDFGYDIQPLNEYRKVMKIFKSCQRETQGMKLLFTSAEQERLADIN